ncbi:MAG: hypothetical protein HKO87_07350 [Acidimicrobiia bacterium]|nr:hypothetical protein [Acidimicrobiia bacterium]
MIPDSFGDVTGEYLALKRGAGVVAGARGLVWIKGPDAVDFVDGLISQDLAAMAPGSVARSLLLSPRGKLVAPHWLLRGDGIVGLITDAGYDTVTAAALARFKIRVDADISIDERPVLEVWGQGAPGVLLGLGFDPTPGWAENADGVVAALGFRHEGPPRSVLIGSQLEEVVAAGAVPVGKLARTAVLIERGEPVMGVDVDEGTIPAEADLVDGAVSFTKGCYLGQELVARIDSRGHVNRLGRGLVFSEAVLPPPRASVVVADDVVGEVTSVAESLDMRAPVAYATVRAEVEPGSPVVVRWEGGQAAATVRAFPLEPGLIESSHSSNTT